jgi:hypothetical protein
MFSKPLIVEGKVYTCGPRMLFDDEPTKPDIRGGCTYTVHGWGGSLKVCFEPPARLVEVGLCVCREPYRMPSKVTLVHKTEHGESSAVYFPGSITRDRSGFVSVELGERDQGQLWHEVFFEFNVSEERVAVQPVFKALYDRFLPPLADCIPEELPDSKAITFKCNDGDVRMSRALAMLMFENLHLDSQTWTMNLKADNEDFLGFSSKAMEVVRDVMTTQIMPAALLLDNTELFIEVVDLLYFLLAYGSKCVWPAVRDLLPRLQPCEKRVSVMELASRYGDAETMLVCANHMEVEFHERINILMREHMHLFEFKDSNPAALAAVLRAKPHLC